MNKQDSIVDQALKNVGQNMAVRANRGKWTGYALLIIGVALLYLGFSNGKALELSFGFLFLLYGLFRLFHVRRTNKIMGEIRSEMEQLKETEKSKDN